MKTILISLLLTTAAFAQSGRNVVLTWNDPNTGLVGQTYSVYKAPGLCSGTPVFSKIATAIPTKTYTDSNVAVGVFCYTATVTASSIESSQAVPVSATVGPQALTTITVVVQDDDDIDDDGV